MSQRFQTRGIILKRIDYAEADRILTFCTPDTGKLTAIAKGVRKPKSKLAGGIELFSVCDIGLVKGRGSMDTLVSTRLRKHYGHVSADYDRLQIAYGFLRLIDKITESDAGPEYFELLMNGLEGLDDARLDDDSVACWFYAQSMKLHGSVANLLEDINGHQLRESTTYAFSIEDGGFFASEHGVFAADDIKAWRVFHSADLQQLRRVRGLEKPANKSLATLRQFAEFQL